ncbi:adenylate/guanylate cyclase domain-containing protein [Desulfobacterales bacterium HSG2]|nr:adenylate/guanylate cyclase domain-containing protein [Desulfobacterales bacterium HSG2]
MADIAQPVAEYIYNLAVRDHSPAFLLVGKDGSLRDWGGKLEFYGISDLEKGKPIGDKVFILEGFFPFDEEDGKLSCVETETGVSADIHIFAREEGYWVLFLDATRKEALQLTFQQKANELCLLRDRHTKILDQYLGKEIAERLSQLNIQDSGESKEVSTLFADIRGFTFFSEQRSPAEVFKLLNTYLASMIQPVLDEGGIVDKFMGDAVMAVFGIQPSDLPPPIQAVNAAFQIIENVRSMQKMRRMRTEDTLDIGIGIASGQVFLGVLGTRNRKNLSAIGHNVNLAARLEDQARPNEILIDENTFCELDHDVRDRFSETRLQLKGICGPLRVFSCEVR